MIPPLKRGSSPQMTTERGETRASQHELSERPGEFSDREFILGKLHEQTEYIVGKISDLRHDTDTRFLQLEKDKLEDDRTRFEVQKMTATVRDLLDSDRSQNASLVSLQAALKPSVEATASIEGHAAGKVAGNRAGKLWGMLGAVLAVVAAGALQQCEQQIARGAFDPLPPKPASTAATK